MPNNSTVFLKENGPPVIIEQGPEWLVAFYLAPPPWVNPLLKTIGVLVAAIVAYRLYQRGWRIDEPTQVEMQLTVGMLVGIITATLAMVNWFDQPYFVDVMVGFAAGYGSLLAAQTRLLPFEWSDLLSNTSERLAVTWGLLAIAAYALPIIANVNGEGMALWSSRMILVAIGIAMMLYDATLFSEDE